MMPAPRKRPIDGVDRLIMPLSDNTLINVEKDGDELIIALSVFGPWYTLDKAQAKKLRAALNKTLRGK